ncbi:hypothetical protein [Nocardia kruczakiae]|uniref:hypothetical protein n=1 Tax=Nocardia kruczakiae TaxID=261477 RepID=UPI000A8D4803|nr:hypothetical protein [Nocardia kruczakiae]
MGAYEAPRAIVEHEDRWLLKPLRGRTVTRMEWKSDHLELVLDDTAGITDHSIFEIHPLDAWTGQPVTPPHGPGRPDYLKGKPESDDIND